MIKRHYFFIVITVIIGLLIIGELATFLFFWKKQQFWQTKIDTLAVQIKQQQSDQSDLQSKLMQAMQNNQQSNRQQSLNEIAYLLNTANLYLQINHDKNNAIKTLQLAAHHLQMLNDPTLLPLQKTLASDLNRLNEAPQIDVTELLLKVQTLAESVQRLPEAKPKPPTATVEQNSLPWYKHPLSAGWSNFKKLFTVRHGESEKEVSSLWRHEWLKENILLTLAQTQWAVLQQNAELYQQNLSQAQQQLTNNYSDTPQRNEILNRLAELMAINISPPLPNINASFQALQQVFKEPKTEMTPTETTPTERAPVEKAPSSPPPTQGIEI